MVVLVHQGEGDDVNNDITLYCDTLGAKQSCHCIVFISVVLNVLGGLVMSVSQQNAVGLFSTSSTA